MLGVDDPSLIDRLTEQWNADTPPGQDLHYLICLSRLPGTRSEQATERTAAGAWPACIPRCSDGAMFVSRNWPLRVGEAVGELMRHDPKLPEALIACEEFRIPIQAVLARADAA